MSSNFRPLDSPAAKLPRTGRQAGRVVLNVGGTRFETTETTLVNGGVGYFALRFGRTGAVCGVDDDDDDIFVDCDGRLFAHVLHWMRRRALPAAILDDAALIDDVAGEADFYGLDCLREACNERRRAIEEERKRPRTARSFSLRVAGRGRGRASVGKFLRRE